MPTKIDPLKRAPGCKPLDNHCLHFRRLCTQHPVMKQNTAVVVILWAISLVSFTQIVIDQIDIATTKQCAANDWPVEADQQHRDWCIANGYKI